MKFNSLKSYNFPDSEGHFGPYGGSFVAETLFAALEKLDNDYAIAIKDDKFLDEFEKELKTFVGRPSPIFHARRWSEKIGGAQLFFKRDVAFFKACCRSVLVRPPNSASSCWGRTKAIGSPPSWE